MDFAVLANRDDGVAVVAVVADGISSAPRVAEAPWIAVRAGIRSLAEGVGRGEDPAGASLAAAGAAHRALTEQAAPEGAPAATYASAVVSGERITVCWLGVCRAYWLPAGSPAGQEPDDSADRAVRARLLSRDDTLAEELGELVATGRISPEAAAGHPEAAHVITGWLGADHPAAAAHVEQFTPAGLGALLLCTDGLCADWPDTADLAAMAMPAAMTRPLSAAADLVRFAVDSGGHDNATAVIIPFPPRDDLIQPSS